MRLPKNQLLTSACLSLLCLGVAYPAIASPESEAQAEAEAEIQTQEVAQRRGRQQQQRFSGTSGQFEIVGHVRSIVGHVVTVRVEDVDVVGVPGIAANDGEPTFVTIAEEERGEVVAMYMPHDLLGITGLVPGARIYASASDRGGKDCVDYFKVISAANYERTDVGAVRSQIRREFRNIGSPAIPQLPPVQPVPRQVRPSRPLRQRAPVRGLW